MNEYYNVQKKKYTYLSIRFCVFVLSILSKKKKQMTKKSRCELQKYQECSCKHCRYYHKYNKYHLPHSEFLCLLQCKEVSKFLDQPLFNDLFYVLFPIVQNAENILSSPITNIFLYTHFGQTATVDSPNFDTLYSVALLDFRQINILNLNVPHIGNDPFGQPRYYSFGFYDINLNLITYIGKRTVGNPAATSYSIGPENSNDVVVPSKFVVLIYRLYANIYDNADIIVANSLRIITTITPDTAIAQNDAIPITAVHSKESPIDVQYFLEQAQRALIFQKEPILKAVVKRLLKDSECSTVFNALQATFSQSQAKINTTSKTNTKTWVKYAANIQLENIPPLLSFATIQWNVLYANESEEAIYYIARFSDSGLPFNGNTQHSITFSSLPPVNGFWSLTAYSNNGFVPVNSSMRYTIGTSSQPIMNDGLNYKIFIGQTNPETPVENNYLQPPAEQNIYFILRLYIPLTQTYEPPSIRIEPFV